MVEVLISVDNKSYILNEAETNNDQWKDKNGGILYIREREIEQMGPNYNMKNYVK